MEKRHLHNGVDARAEAALAGDFGRVNDIKPRFFLIQRGLDFLRQARPDFLGAVWGIEQENTARLKTLNHLILVDKLQLVTANEIGLRNQIGRTNRLLADAQMGNRQAASFFRIIDEIALREPRRRVTDNLDIVFGGRDAAVAAEPVKQGFQLRLRRQGIFYQRQGKVGDVIVDADGKAWFGFGGAQFVENRQHALRSELF